MKIVNKTGPERGSLERTILGALRDTINQHGPITEENVSSAAKRVLTQLFTWHHNNERSKNGNGKNATAGSEKPPTYSRKEVR
jgi:hypothetical protein